MAGDEGALGRPVDSRRPLVRSMITVSMRERDGHVAADLADCYLDLDMRGVVRSGRDARSWS